MDLVKELQHKDDDEGISLGLNKDKPQNDLHQPIYNDNIIFPKTKLFLTPDIF